jgi:diguanylate cyclase (GGDEF)-like protein/PAS domain S-box-containing protein
MAKKGKQTKSRMSESAELTQALMRCPGLGIYIVQDGRFRYANPLFYELTGYTEQELRSIHPLDLVHPEDRELVREKAIENLKGDVVLPYEYRFIKKNGDVMWNLERLASIEYMGKRAAVGSFMDVTDSKMMEEALAKSEEKYRAVLEGMGESYYEVDLDGNFTFFNGALCRQMGYSREELMGMNYKVYTPPEHAKRVFKIYSEVYRTGEPVQVEMEEIRKDGTRLFVENSVLPLRNDRGEIIGLGGIGRDVTERKKAEEALVEEATRRRILIEQSSDGIVVVDENGKVNEVNQRFAEMLGYSLEEARELHIWDWDTQWTREQLLEMLRSDDEGGRHIETYHRRKDGTVYNVEISTNGTKIGGQKLVFCVCRDITERKRAEEALRLSEQNFHDSIENSPLGIRVLDKEGKTLYANRALLDLWGYGSVEELEAVPKKQRYTPQSYAEHLERFEKRKRGERGLLAYETSIVRSDGQVRIIWASRGELIWNGEKRFQVVYQDMTERKRAEEALRRSEENFRDSMENSPLGIRVLDKEGKTLYANRALLDTWGYSSVEELEAVPKKQRYTPETYAEHLERLEKRRRGEPAPLSYETGIVRSDGQVRILSVSRGELLWNGEKRFQIVSQDITEYKRLEEALTKSEERYRTVLEQMEEAYYETDIAGKFTFGNDAMCRQLGYSREELMGMSFKVITPPDDVKRVFGLYNEVYRTGEPLTSVSIDRIRKDGTRIFVETSIFPLRNESGAIIGFRGLAGDVTERRLAEEALAKSEERYRTVLEQMEEAYFETDIAGNYTFVNDALCRQSGYSREELIGMSYKVYTPEDDVPRVYKAFNRVYETGKPVKGVPMGRIRKDGTRISTETAAFPLQNESGEMIGFRGITRDVTERVQMIDALSQSEERYRTILAEIQEGYYEVDLAGNFTFVNDAICRQLGYSREELIGMNYQDYALKEEIKGIYKAWNKVYRTGKPLQSYPFTGIRKNKKQVFLEASVSPSRDNEGKIIGFRSVSRDVTERAQYEQKLAEMATHDALTGLPNRTLLSDRFTVALALSRRSRSRLAVLMLDLDRFKAVNDSMGHDVGDKLLKAVGKRLKETVRKSDTVARIGGDEFVLVLPQTPHAEEAAKFAQRILDAFREPFVFDGHRLHITTSIGIAVYPGGGKDIESLLKSADTAMYWAKEQGRDIYRFYDGNEAATLLAKRRTA